MLIEYIVAIATSFALSVLLSYYIIPILKGHKVGQIIREEGPSWHSSKAGTPTMGGICFIMAILIVSAGFTVFYSLKNKQSELIPLALTLGLGVFNGLIGFVDDYCKLLKKQNEGLTPLQKIVLQTVVAILYVVALRFTGHIDTNLFIPFLKTNIELGFVYYIFAVFLILGIVNSVNLTDGVDGLASSVTLVVAGFFGFVAFNILNESLILISGLLIGALIGFLVFNIHPAKVFMGDTGSLFLGGMVTGAAFLMENPFIIVIAGGIYVIEAFSVMLQVSVFKISGRKIRVFKMSPIHHHFEQCGWKEGKVVSVFSLVTALLCAVAWFSSF